MNKTCISNGIRQELDQGLENLSPVILRRLESARRQALLKQKPSTAPSSPLAFLFRPAFLVLAAALALGLTTYLHGQYEISEMAALDSDLLIEDLPPDAFIDKGFHKWLDEPSDG